MTGGPSFENIFAVMAAASLGDGTARVSVPDEGMTNEGKTNEGMTNEGRTNGVPLRFAMALNVLLDDLAFRAAQAKAAMELSATQTRLLEVESAAAASREKGEKWFRGLLEAAPDALIIVAPGGEIALVNAQAEKLFGHSRDELLDQPIEILSPLRYRGNSEVRSIGSAVDTCGLHKDGSEFPIEISSSPIETPDGLLVLSAIRDITERKRTETALTAANRELESFSYSVAHDLRAPLRGMNGFAHILLEEYQDKLDPAGLDCLREISKNALRMAGLIDALLSLARVTRSELKPEPTDLTAVARTVASQLAAGDPQHRIEVVVEPGLSAFVDPQLARNLLDNLLGNAWKFSAKVSQGRIDVGVMDQGGVPTFFVRDNGAGFDMAYAGKLFTPFQRLHTNAEFPGTGIGLATAQRIVRRHGGRIWAEGTVNGGATFYFTLHATPIGESP
jgi:PAS domain S-box-containing protein